MAWSAPQWVGLLLVTAGTATDLLYRRIPNWITLPAIICAIIYHGVADGWADGAQSAVAGLFVGCALLFFPFAMGGMGGGDVKLLGALGAWLGSLDVLNIFLFSAWTGALWAALIMARDKTLAPALKQLLERMMYFYTTGRMQRTQRSGATMPYALSIAAGYIGFLVYGRLI